MHAAQSSQRDFLCEKGYKSNVSDLSVINYRYKLIFLISCQKPGFVFQHKSPATTYNMMLLRYTLVVKKDENCYSQISLYEFLNVAVAL